MFPFARLIEKYVASQSVRQVDVLFSRRPSYRLVHLNFKHQSTVAQPPFAQSYVIPTYDSTFKYILSDDLVRLSFINAFVPNIVVQNSERLDEHMNPLVKLQALREFLIDNKDFAEEILEDGIQCEGGKEENEFLVNYLSKYDEICDAIPNESGGTLCQLDDGQDVLVVMQVLPDDYFDHKTLACFAGLQRSIGNDWIHIDKVIGINILRDKHWKGGNSSDYMRHFKFEDQLHKDRCIEGLELYQYSIMNAPENMDNQGMKDWVIFMKKAASMSAKDVDEQIKTPGVKLAFERAKINELPPDIRKAYETEDAQKTYYAHRYSIDIAEAAAEAAAEARKEAAAEAAAEVRKETRKETVTEVARAMKAAGIAPDFIHECTNLSLSEINKL